MYVELERMLGFFLVYSFTTCQLNWISQLYMGVSTLNSPYSLLSRGLYAGGSLLSAVGGRVMSYDL